MPIDDKTDKTDEPKQETDATEKSESQPVSDEDLKTVSGGLSVTSATTLSTTDIAVCISRL